MAFLPQWIKVQITISKQLAVMLAATMPIQQLESIMPLIHSVSISRSERNTGSPVIELAESLRSCPKGKLKIATHLAQALSPQDEHTATRSAAINS